MGIIQPIRRLTVLSLFTLVLVVSALPVRAQTTTPGSGLSISPTVSQFTIKPGEAGVESITLKNITSGNIVAKPTVNDFTSDNASGNPQIITDPNKHSPNSIKNFVLGLEDVPLAKGQQKKLSLPLQVPKNASPGAYYGIIRYKAVPGGSNAPKEGELTLSASVGTIVLITVPGNLKEQVQLTALHIYKDNHEGGFFTSKPNAAGVELKNLGNNFSSPFGTVTLQKMFGNKEIYSYQLNNGQPRSNILPGSSRTFRNAIKNISTPGRYTLTANVTYGNGNDILIMKKTFWYVPLWLSLVLLAILLVLIYSVFTAFRGYRRGTRRFKR